MENMREYQEAMEWNAHHGKYGWEMIAYERGPEWERFLYQRQLEDGSWEYGRRSEPTR